MLLIINWLQKAFIELFVVYVLYIQCSFLILYTV